MEYTVLVYKDEEGGFWAEVPSLPGCYSQGETVEETMENVKEAIEAHMTALKDDLQEIQTNKEFVIGNVSVTMVKKQNKKEITKMECLEVYEYLIEIAKNRCKEQNAELDLSSKVGRKKLHEEKILVTYGDVLEKFGEKSNDPKALTELFKILDKINENTKPIILSALVVEKIQFIPGKLFFPKWLPNTKDEDKSSTWIKKLEQIWHHYC